MTSAPDSDLKEYFHFAKLALFNVRTLAALQASTNSDIRVILDKLCHENNLTSPVSLLHQSTFLQFAYICLVWLWERCKREKITNILVNGVESKFNFSQCKKLSGPRELNCPAEFIRLIRNAISHGRVRATDDCFEFSDKDDRKKGSTETIVSLTWTGLGELCEAVLFSVNAYVHQKA